MSEKKRLYFTKMQGAGNDYLYVDALGSPTSLKIDDIDLPDLARKISDRHFGVGGDGLIAILPSASADFRMRMFNSDGSEAQMCGNASRCVGKYLYDLGFTKKREIRLETGAGIKILHLSTDGSDLVKEVTVEMGKAFLKRGEIPMSGDPDSKELEETLSVDGLPVAISGVGMGNPHGVVFVDEITDYHVHCLGPKLETDPIWPEKANIEFVRVIDRHNIEMRVWERGSGETLACGTGSCASVVATCLKGLTEEEVNVKLLGGELKIRFDKESGRVFMTGPAEFVADGYFYL